MLLLRYVEGVVTGEEDGETEVSITSPDNINTIYFPTALLPADCRSFATPLDIALSEDGNALAFKRRIVPARIGPPTRLECELEEWANGNE